MDSLAHQIAERRIHRALPLETAHSGESRRLDVDSEMAFAAAVVAGMAAMAGTVVDYVKPSGSEPVSQAFLDFRGDGSGECAGHPAYI